MISNLISNEMLKTFSNVRNKHTLSILSKIEILKLTISQTSGSKKEATLVLVPGNGPGGLVIFPPSSLEIKFTSWALLYKSSVPIAI